LAVAVAVAGLIGTPAFAADLAVKAPPPPPPPPFSWTGFYIGGHVGAGVLLDTGFVEETHVGVRAATPAPADQHGIGALAGGQIGANYQVGMLVLGIEGEGFWSDMRNRTNFFDIGSTSPFATAHVKNKWDADVAGRFGLAIDRALIYRKAGWVWGWFDWDFASIPPVLTTHGSATLDGLLIGVGLEYAFAPNWTAKFEYDYLGFQTKDVLFTSNIPPPNTFIESVSADKHIFKLGVNYLFGGPIVARF
jgi:outer membrane immunogenic protein